MFKLQFKTFENEHLLCHKESILQRTIKMIITIKTFDEEKKKRIKTY